MATKIDQKWHKIGFLRDTWQMSQEQQANSNSMDPRFSRLKNPKLVYQYDSILIQFVGSQISLHKQSFE